MIDSRLDMVIKNENTKDCILYEIKCLLCQKSIDYERLIFLFSEYCMEDLGLYESEIELEKKDNSIFNSYGSYSCVTKKIKLILSKKNKSLYELLNTVAHELKHKERDTINIKHFKIVGQFDKAKFPIQKFHSFLYGILFNMEEIDLNSLQFTSVDEKEAREYAINLLDKFVNDLKALITQNKIDKQFNKYVKFIDEKNQNEREKENKVYKNKLERAKDAYDFLRANVKCFISHVFEVTKKGPTSLEDKTIYNYFQKYGTVSPFINAYLSIYSDKEIVNLILTEAEKINDRESLISCLNHYSTEISSSQLLKGLSLLNKNKKVNFETVSNQLNSFNENVVNNFFISYIDSLKQNKRKHYEREFL